MFSQHSSIAPKRFSRHLAWVYLAILTLGCGAVGWLLTAFSVSWFVWIGTLGVILHLVRAEADAIALASTWVVSIVSVGVVIKAWIPVWGVRVPFEHAQVWAIVLLLLWLGAIGLVVLLAFARQPMRSIGCNIAQAMNRLVILAWAALGSGWFIYHITL